MRPGTLLLWVWLQLPASAVAADGAQAGLEALAQEVHQSLINRQALLDDRLLSSHCEALLEQLFPDQVGAFAVFVSRDHRPLAFSLPNGHIYLSAGLFLQIQAEDQLAFVLAHEAAHVLAGHSRRRLDTLSMASAGATAGGFLNEFELEADQWASEMLLKAGLSMSGIGDFMQRLGQLHGQPDQSREAVELARRIRKLQSLASSETSLGSATILSISVSTRLAALQRLLDLGQWRVVLDCIASDCSVALPPGRRHRIWADALRISGLAENAQRASEHYQSALQGHSADWQAWLGLALLQDHLRHCQAANAAWREVLRTAPGATVGIAFWRTRLEHSACVD